MPQLLHTRPLLLALPLLVFAAPDPARAKLGVSGGCGCPDSQLSASGGSYCSASSVTYTSDDGTSFTLALGDPDGAGPEDAVYACGQYANGDVWVVGKSDGTGGSVVRVESTAPDWEAGAPGCPSCASGRHGWTTDPSALGAQHLDGRQVGPGFVPPTAAEPLPRSYDVGAGYRSFIKQVGLDTVDATSTDFNVCRIGNHFTCARFNGVVTFVECVSGCAHPADGDGDGQTGDEFRPGYMGSGAQKVAGLRMDDVAARVTSSLGGLDASLIDPGVLADWTIGDVADNWRYPRLDHATGFMQWIHMGIENFPSTPGGCEGCSRQEYGHEMAVVNAAGLQRLQLDDWALGAPGDEGYQALAGLLQHAIDLFAIHRVTGKRWRHPENGHKFFNSGGHHSGRKLPSVLLAHLLADDPSWGAEVAAFASGGHFFEDGQVHAIDGVPYFGIRDGDCDAENRVIPGGDPFRHQCANSTGPGQWLRYDALCRGGSDWTYPWVDSTIASYHYVSVRTLGLEPLWADDPYLDYAYTFRAGGRGGDPDHRGGSYCAPDGRRYGYDWGEGDPDFHVARRHDFGEAMWSAFSPACNDGADNDGDGWVDALDPECASPADLSERLHACGDGLDNDGDGLVDHPDDPGCRHPAATHEAPSCDDGIDNDGDGSADLADPDCPAPWGRLERPLASGDIVVSDGALPHLVRVDPATGAQEVLAELGYLESPLGLGFDADGGLLVADDTGARIVRIAPDGEQRVEASGGVLFLPADVALEASGDALLADLSSLVRVERPAAVQDVLATFSHPAAAAALEPDGRVLVAVPAAGELVRVDPGSGAQESAASGGWIADPVAVAVGPGGEIVVGNGSSAVLVVVDPASGSQTPIASDGFLSAISGVAASAGGDAIVTDVGTASVVRVPIAGGAQELVSQGGAIPAPVGVAVLRPACGDGIDNDRDGLVDAAQDTGCSDAGDESERGPALPCDDGVDNDGDTLVDFPDDLGCDSAADADESSAVLVCDDGIDNDGDATADFPADLGCSDPLDTSEQNSLLECDDGADNDGDGAIDFAADPSCLGKPGGREKLGTACDDGIDNDGDGDVDFAADPSCLGDPEGEESLDSYCDDGVDNDGDGLVDYPDDPDCRDASWPVELAACSDGADNDGDGLVDLADPDCAAPWALSEASSGPACGNGVDDDGDGLVDLADPGCGGAGDRSERAPELVCDNGIDDDGDGAIDHPADPGCAGPADLSETTADVACDDGADNDGDGLVDYPDDPECQSPLHAPEGPLADDDDPRLSGLAVSVGESDATIAWTTDEPARARVDFGVPPAFDRSAQSATWSRTASLAIEGLLCGTVHRFAAIAEDPAGNVAASPAFEFTTLPCGSERGLQAHWRLEDGAGAAAHDSSGKGRNGALQGPTWLPETADASAFSLDFDGIDDRVDVPAFEVGGDEISIAAWLRADGFESYPDGRIVAKAESVLENDHDWMLSTEDDLDGMRLRFRVRTQTATDTLIAREGDVPLGTWIHATAVYDGAEMRLYRNADEVGSAPKSGQLVSSPGRGVALGDQPAGAGPKRFDGALDDVRIYSRALSPPEIAALYGNQAGAIGDLVVTAEGDRAELSWSTDLASSAHFAFGRTPACEEGQVRGDTFHRRHRALALGLERGPLYYYCLTSTTDGGVSTVREGTFVVAPLVPVPAPALLALALALGATGAAGLRRRSVRARRVSGALRAAR